MNHGRFPTLSTKTSSGPSVSAPKKSAQRKSNTVAPKQPKSPLKAKRVIDPARKLATATARRSKCMEGSAKLVKYFNKSTEQPSDPVETLLISSDDGSPSATQVSRDRRKSEIRSSRFVDVEAGCSDSDSQAAVHTEEEEVDPTMGGFIVSDGHQSSDEGDDWLDVHFARRLSRRKSPVSPTQSVERDAPSSQPSEEEESGTDLGWEVGAQPLSPVLSSPVRLDDEEFVEATQTPVEQEAEEVEVELPVPGLEYTEQDPKKFRFNNRYVHLVYKSHLPKSAYIAWLKETTARPDAWVRLAHETADKNCPYRHTHVVVDFGTRVDTRDVHKFCYVNPEIPDKVDKCKRIHPHIRKLLCNQAFQDCKVYIGKEDPDNKDLKAPKDKAQLKGANLVESIQRAPTVNVALRNHLRRLGDAAGIIQIFDYRVTTPVDLYIPPKPTSPWATELLAQVEHQKCPNWDRKIIWYVDHRGGAGKTALAKYLDRMYSGENGFDWLVMAAVNDYTAAAHQVAEAAKSGFQYKGFIIDCPRSFMYKEGLYQTLESFKDGKVTSTKYQGRNMGFNTPWVIVMSNFWPKVDKISLDRWDIRRINADTGVAEHLAPDAEVPPEFPQREGYGRYNGNGYQAPRMHDIPQERE